MSVEELEGASAPLTQHIWCWIMQEILGRGLGVWGAEQEDRAVTNCEEPLSVLIACGDHLCYALSSCAESLNPHSW